MPDVATIGWFPVATLLIGYAIKALSDWVEYRRTREREREARDAARQDRLFERRITFQRQTLLDLQDAIAKLARATGAAHHADTMAYRETKQWQRQLLPEGLSENFRFAQVPVGMLSVRVRDQLVRDLVKTFETQAVAVVFSNQKETSDQALLTVGTASQQLNERIGELLRKLDDDELPNT